MGTYNSGCAKIEVPVLNSDPDGPMLMVSHANTNPGLTKTWDAGEPAKYQPSGKKSFARVITTDEIQGQAAAQFASKTLGTKKAYILNDNQTYGQGVGKAFEEAAKTLGITVIANEPWGAKQTSYAALFTKIKTTSPDLINACSKDGVEQINASAAEQLLTALAPIKKAKVTRFKQLFAAICRGDRKPDDQEMAAFCAEHPDVVEAIASLPADPYARLSVIRFI